MLLADAREWRSAELEGLAYSVAAAVSRHTISNRISLLNFASRCIETHFLKFHGRVLSRVISFATSASGHLRLRTDTLNFERQRRIFSRI